MPGAVDRGADIGDAAGGAGGGFVVDDHHRLDGVRGIVREPGFDLRGVGATTPIAGNEIDLDPEARRHLTPQGREVTGLHHQHLVARRQRVDDCGLPGARPR